MKPSLEALLRVPQVDSGLRFDIAPDGARVVFAWNLSGNWELYELSLAGEAPPRMLSGNLAGAKFAPVYSPDGKRLAYALDLDGSESYQVMLLDLAQGRHTNLTPDIVYAHQPNLSWSADGQMLAVLSDRHGQFALHLLPVDGSAGRMIKNVFRPCRDARWSPDGKWIALEADASACDQSLYLVPVNRARKGPRVNTIEIRHEGRALNASQATMPPDSRFVAFSAEKGNWHAIGVYDVQQGGQIRWLSDPQAGDDHSPAWSKSGGRLAWVHSQGARTCLQVWSGTAPLEEFSIGAGVHHLPQFRGEDLVLVYEDSQRPCDLWQVDWARREARQLTHSLPPELQPAQFLQPEEVWYPGSDGSQVPALLYRGAPGASALVEIHGGPNWHLQFSWQASIQALCGRGWTILAPNYRGSTGYGRAWQNASRFDMGGKDAEDGAAGAQYLLESGLAAPGRIAVSGRSHGGFLAMCCLTNHPDLWAAGSAVVPFLNWLKSHRNSREDLQHWNIENMGDPEERREAWIAHSPYFFLDRVQAPVQLICAGRDPRCPASDSLDAQDRLVQLGKQVELWLYKEEGHSFLNIKNVIDAEQKRVKFLSRHLGEKPAPQPGREKT